MMPDINNFFKEFPESTKIKLKLYKTYIDEWLPVFLMQKKNHLTSINIFDLFCGPGCDAKECLGSPLLLINSINTFLRNNPALSPPRVRIFFNDKDPENIRHLKINLGATPILCEHISIEYSHKEFDEIFSTCIEVMNNRHASNFVFIDQFGISALTDDKFKILTNLPRTDWIGFFASSIVHRMKDHPAIKRYISIPDQGRMVDIHRFVTDYYRNIIPQDKEYFLVPFSIKKNNNIYGLIFGSPHPLGAEKFISSCWKVDTIAGEANFNIEDGARSPYGQLSLVPPKKLMRFEHELRTGIISGVLKTNKDIYLLSLRAGVRSEHARNVLKALSEQGIIKQTVPVSYNTVYKEKKIATISIK